MKWWERVLGGPEEVGLPPPTLFGFVRIGTNPRVITPPIELEKALELVETWVARPNTRVLAPGARHLEIAFGLLRTAGTAGNLTTDAQLAAYAIENSATLYSCDTDFARFHNVAWKNPLK